jgi:hypothetical protein
MQTTTAESLARGIEAAMYSLYLVAGMPREAWNIGSHELVILCREHSRRRLRRRTALAAR